MNIPDRKEYIYIIRTHISNTLTKIQWKNLGNGEQFKLHFLCELRQFLKILFNNDNTFKHWDNVILPELSKDWKSTNIHDCFILLKSKLTFDILYDIEHECFTKFKNHLINNWVDEFLIELLSKHFKYNFFFINANEKKLYKTFQSQIYDKNIIFYWIPETHYEPIGEIKNNKIKRIFDLNDDIIILFKNILHKT